MLMRTGGTILHMTLQSRFICSRLTPWSFLLLVVLTCSCGESGRNEPVLGTANDEPSAKQGAARDEEKTTISESSSASEFEEETADPLAEPLFAEAALEGKTNEVRATLKAGSNPNMWDETGRTPLMLASFNGHTGVVKMLLEAGANVHAKDPSGRTALMYACTGSNVETVRLLLENGAKVNEVDQGERWSPLMFAAAEGHGEVVDLLLQYEADVTLSDIDGDTAADFAQQRGYSQLANYLRKRIE